MSKHWFKVGDRVAPVPGSFPGIRVGMIGEIKEIRGETMELGIIVVRFNPRKGVPAPNIISYSPYELIKQVPLNPELEEFMRAVPLE